MNARFKPSPVPIRIISQPKTQSFLHQSPRLWLADRHSSFTGKREPNNWEPVDELPPTPCKVIRGKIPSALQGGAYIRNGPNPQHHSQSQRARHLFEGDGMLHSLLFPDDGSDPIFCSRFVQTYRLKLEKKAGKNVIPSFFSDICGPQPLAHIIQIIADVITRKIDLSSGMGQANASLAFFGGRLFALDESDLPYAVHVSSSGNLTTLGRCNFEGRLSTCMTAHPKKDPSTNEVFATRYGLSPPFLTFFRFDAQGRKQPDVPIFSLSGLSFVHDFAITEKHAIFCDNGCFLQPVKMVLFRAPLVRPNGCKVSRLGVIPRYAESEEELEWFDVPGFSPLHTLNAWEENGGAVVKLVACNLTPFERILDRIDLVDARVEMVTVDLRNKTVSRVPISSEKLDFGVINSRYVGRRTRYAYYCVIRQSPKFGGIVKLDMEKKGGGDGIVACRMYGKERFGGEAVFVPAPEEGDGEDDGYLVSYLHDESTGKSSFVVMDARSPQLEIVAEVALPRRVPYGFHGLFLSQEELQAQKGNRNYQERGSANRSF